MFVYKKLKGSDVALVPFNTHKQFSFVWGGTYDNPKSKNILTLQGGSGCLILSASYGTPRLRIPSLLHPQLSQSNILFAQLQHLFYGNNSGQSMNGSYPFNVASKFGEADIQNSERYLDKDALVISIPQKYYGSQIKPGSFSYSRNRTPVGSYGTYGTININQSSMCFDDGKGNLLEFNTLVDAIYQDGVPSNSVLEEDKGISLISDQNPFTSKFLIEGNHPSASIDLSRLMDPKNRLFSIYPKHAYKKTRLDLDEYGRSLVNVPRNGITPEDGTYPYISHFKLEGVMGNDWNQHTNLFTNSPTASEEGKGGFLMGDNYVPRLYSDEFVYDDSHYRNLLTYKYIWFENDLLEDSTGDGYLTHNYTTCQPSEPFVNNYQMDRVDVTAMNFIANHNNNCTGSQIISPHNEKFNFNLEDDFSITFHIKLPEYNQNVIDFDPLNAAITYSQGDAPEDMVGPYGKQYIIGKSTTRTTVGPPQETSTGGVINLSATGSSSETTESASPQFPFEIYIDANNNLGSVGQKSLTPPFNPKDPGYAFVFAMSDGINTVTASCAPIFHYGHYWQHVTAVYEGVHSGSVGRLSITTTGKSGEGDLLSQDAYTNPTSSTEPHLQNPLQNNANIYIGCKGGSDFGTSGSAINHAGYPTQHIGDKFMQSGSFFEGSLFGINIWNYALHPSESKALAHMFTYGATKYIGNIFYEQGIAVITNPQYLQTPYLLGGINPFTPSVNPGAGGIPDDWEHGDLICPSFAHDEQSTSSVIFQGTHTIYENEYQCTVQENEMNYSTNISTRKIPSEEGQEVADFTTSSLFQPYVTTVGLYNEENELLVVGKLGQPVRTSQETDTTFVLRWDT